MPKKYIFIQNGSSILDDISLQNVLHTLLRFFCFLFMFNNSILSLQKASKQQTRWFYEMSWPLKTLTKLTLQNVQLCLLGALLQNALVSGLIVTTKCLYIIHL